LFSVQSVFFSFEWDWGLKSGFPACKARALPLKPTSSSPKFSHY
jgi:hypothetical protein